MKPRVGIYLSKRTAARLAMAAKRREVTKSALVEAAIDRFLASEDLTDAEPLTSRLAGLSGQIDQLDRSLGIVSEVVSLHARFHMAVAPDLPASRQPAACRLGSARFDEFAAQVERRVQLGAPLMQETINRIEPTAPVFHATRGESQPGGVSAASAAGSDASSWIHEVQNAAVREDGSSGTFRVFPRRPLHPRRHPQQYPRQ
jgi:hypothetical protein